MGRIACRIACLSIALSCDPPAVQALHTSPTRPRPPTVADPPAEQPVHPNPAPLDDALWSITESTLAHVAQQSAWSEADRSRVHTILRWRHDQLVAYRERARAGALAPGEGPASLIATADAARAQIVATVGPDRAQALSEALQTSRLGAGL